MGTEVRNKFEGMTKEISDNICRVLECESEDIKGWEKLTVGLTNSAYKFKVRGNPYLYRMPGINTEIFLNRECEAQAENIAKEIGIDETLIAIDPETGWKLSHFVEGCEYIDPNDPEDMKTALGMLKKFHETETIGSNDFAIDTTCEKYFRLMEGSGLTEGDMVKICENKEIFGFNQFRQITKELARYSAIVERDGFKRVLCHNDTWFWNFIKDTSGKVTLIDWEYCGNNFPSFDVADIAVGLGYTMRQSMDLAEMYEGHKINTLEYRYHMLGIVLVGWFWFVWAIYQESVGTEVEDMKMWFDISMIALENVRTLF
jgi:thiamine kinase-like enzyme